MTSLLGYSVFVTYMLEPRSQSLGGGNSQYMYCNYINKIVLDSTDPYVEEIWMRFPNVSDFKFLSNDINNITGYTANYIYCILQIVDNSQFNSLEDVKPNPSQWKIVDLTPQITTHTSGNTLTSTELTSMIFKISLVNYNTFDVFNLHNYITYPTLNTTETTQLSFGDESYFLGNISSDVKAIAYSPDISIPLSLNEFNYSTNETWIGGKVYITEIGIYDDQNNLVAVGKLNNPIAKDSTISRTIVFDLDF